MPAPTFRRALWLLVWSLLWSVSVQQDTYSFTNPPPEDSSIANPSYNVGDDIDIQWVGPNNFVSVRLVQVLPNNDFNEFTSVFRNVTNLGGTYTWQITLGGMNLTSSNEFFFNIFVEGETSPRAITHYFNLTQATTTTSATSTASATVSVSSFSSSLSSSSTSSITSSPTISPSNTANPSSTNAVVPSSDSGLSTGAKAGIGIGVAVGAIALIAAALFFWRRQQGRTGNGTGGAEAGQPFDNTYQRVSQQPPRGDFFKAHSGQSGPSEAPANYVASEMPGSGPAPLEMADTSRPYP